MRAAGRDEVGWKEDPLNYRSGIAAKGFLRMIY